MFYNEDSVIRLLFCIPTVITELVTSEIRIDLMIVYCTVLGLRINCRSTEIRFQFHLEALGDRCFINSSFHLFLHFSFYFYCFSFHTQFRDSLHPASTEWLVFMARRVFLPHLSIKHPVFMASPTPLVIFHPARRPLTL